jgi:hypothetical protein
MACGFDGSARRLMPGFFIGIDTLSHLRLQTELALPRAGRQFHRNLMVELKFFDN